MKITDTVRLNFVAARHVNSIYWNKDTLNWSIKRDVGKRKSKRFNDLREAIDAAIKEKRKNRLKSKE